MGWGMSLRAWWADGCPLLSALPSVLALGPFAVGPLVRGSGRVGGTSRIYGCVTKGAWLGGCGCGCGRTAAKGRRRSIVVFCHWRTGERARQVRRADPVLHPSRFRGRALGPLPRPMRCRASESGRSGRPAAPSSCSRTAPLQPCSAPDWHTRPALIICPFPPFLHCSSNHPIPLGHTPPHDTVPQLVRSPLLHPSPRVRRPLPLRGTARLSPSLGITA